MLDKNKKIFYCGGLSEKDIFVSRDYSLRTIHEQLSKMIKENLFDRYSNINSIVWSQKHLPEDESTEYSIDYDIYRVNGNWMDYNLTLNERAFNAYFGKDDVITSFEVYKDIFKRIYHILLSFSVNELISEFGNFYVEAFVDMWTSQDLLKSNKYNILFRQKEWYD